MLLQLFLVTDYLKIVFQEAFGRYLDMHELYQQYVNSKFGEPIEYSAYLDIFSETDKIPRKMKTTR
jgi:splicing factor 3A subunit 3